MMHGLTNLKNISGSRSGQFTLGKESRYTVTGGWGVPAAGGGQDVL
jgi:hypothetical protein